MARPISPRLLRRLSTCLASALVVVALMVVAAGPAAAEPHEGWSFHVGVFDVNKSRTAAEAGVEYRWQGFDFGPLDDLVPMAGLTVTDDEAVFAYGGLRWDLPWRTRRFVPSISFAVTAYEDGDGKNLGGTLEFRSALDLAWVLDDGSRLGVGIYHLSNAGIYSFNPGEESVILFWSPAW